MNGQMARLLKWSYGFATLRVLLAILKRAADLTEKLAVGGVLVGAFEEARNAMIMAIICLIGSFALTMLEARMRQEI